MLNRFWHHTEHHPTDQELLSYLDGELRPRRSAAIREHLEACWECRSRLLASEEAVAAVVQFREQVRSAETFTPPSPETFDARLRRLSRDMDERAATPAGTLSWLTTLRPVAGLAVLTLLILTVVMFNRRTTPVVSAAALLERSGSAERALTQQQAVRRLLRVEERTYPDRRLVSRRKVEEWSSGSRRAVRLETGAWIREFAALSPDGAWQWSPSAERFRQIAGPDLTVQEQPEAYLVQYKNHAPGMLREASLSLRRTDLRAVAQTLVLERGAELREFDMAEEGLEQYAESAVPAGVFEPVVVAEAAAAPAPAPKPEPPVAGLDTEVEVLRQLDGAGVLMQEQVRVARDSRQVVVTGRVEDPERVRQPLADLANRGLVRLELGAPQEAAPSPGRAAVVERIEVAAGKIPLDAEVRAYLTRRDVEPARMQDEVEKYARQVVELSLESRAQARVLKQIAGQFTPEQAARLSESARREWHALLAGHARAYLTAAGSWRQMIENLGVSAAPQSRALNMDLAAAARHLAELSATLDRELGRAFSVSPGDPEITAVRSVGFLTLAQSAESLAKGILDRATQ